MLYLIGMTIANNPEIQEKIGKNLRKIREEKGFSQEEVSKSAGISLSYYNKLENGRKNLTQKVLQHLCKALKVKSSEILPF